MALEADSHGSSVQDREFESWRRQSVDVSLICKDNTVEFPRELGDRPSARLSIPVVRYADLRERKCLAMGSCICLVVTM